MAEESYNLSNELFEMGTLFLKYNQGEITEEEQAILDNWVNASAENKQLFATLTNNDELQPKLNLLHEIEGTREDAKRWAMQLIFTGAVVTPVRRAATYSIWKTVAAAAVVTAVLGTSAYFLLKKDTSEVATVQPEHSVLADAAPGAYKAQLVLDDGSTIELDSAGNRKLAQQGNMQVMNADGQLVYKKDATTKATALFNTLKTARGQMYPVKLSDGSAVWLNSSSSIRFPVAFTEQERRVEITGEAYFEVAHNDKKPFTVSVNGTEVQVVGTVFNINSYNDEGSMRTTLLKGAVKVKKGDQQVMIKPGEQAQVLNDNIKVNKEVNITKEVAWKNGLFYFKNEDLKTIMRQIARWYDVDVVYEGNVSKEGISGKIYRNTNLSEVLKLLNVLEVNFKMEGKKLIIKG
ncbi:FecR family protein [Niastella sp. OAS944]|uniref:FecR family protein n=1 Tax=Niastella sp. OAS944 TaxID=2664089 RepID=UPI003493BABF|nr:ferric-dicitrate binding protein FerR (iron transport regulator) [Chitinophagaceae bacterium OAS944]